MNINDKIVELARTPLASPNKFRVAIIPPAPIRTEFPNLRGIEYIAEKVEIPSLGVSNIDYVLDQSLNIQVPFRRVPQGTINITFQMDIVHSIRRFIESWFFYMVKYKSNNNLTYHVSEYYENCTGSIIVEQKTTDSAPRYPHPISTFYNAYPAQAQPFNYDWAEKDAYIPYTVIFNYYDSEIQ